MRIFLALFLLLVPCAWAGEDARDFLNRAADASLSLRQREYAARQILMLADSSASILIAAVNGGDGEDGGLRRQVAARLLGEMGNPAAEAALLEAAFGTEYFLAEAASAALGTLYSRLDDPELYSLYKRGGREAGAVPGGTTGGDDWLVLSLGQSAHRGRFRGFVMRGLLEKYRKKPDSMPPPLAECVWDGLLDANRELRLYSALAAPLTGSSQAPERIAAFLYAENDAKLLIAALQSMAAMRNVDFGEAVLRHTAHDNPMVALEALAALDAMGYGGCMFPDAPGARCVAGYGIHPSTPVRMRAAEVLAGTKNPAALPYLTQALSDRVGANRAFAAEALGALGFSGAVGGLSPLLNDGRPEVRAAAAVALAKLGVVGVAARMIDDMNGDSLPFRRAAARALGEIGDTRAVKPLCAVLSDADSELACLAADALSRLGRVEAGPALYALLRETDDMAVRDAARMALSELFRDDPGTSPANWESWSRRTGVSLP